MSVSPTIFAVTSYIQIVSGISSLYIYGLASGKQRNYYPVIILYIRTKSAFFRIQVRICGYPSKTTNYTSINSSSSPTNVCVRYDTQSIQSMLPRTRYSKRREAPQHTVTVQQRNQPIAIMQRPTDQSANKIINVQKSPTVLQQYHSTHKCAKECNVFLVVPC